MKYIPNFKRMQQILRQSIESYQKGDYDRATDLEKQYFSIEEPRVEVIPEPVRPFIFEGGLEEISDL